MTEEQKFYFERKWRTKAELKNIFSESLKLNRLQQTKRLVSGQKNIILDIGCGAGYLSELLEGKYSKYVGVDILESNVSIAKSIFTKKDVSFSTKNVFSDKSSFKNKSIDYILLLELIEHVDNPGEYIRRCRELLKDKGYLIISTPNATSITNILWNIKNRKKIISAYAIDGTETDHVVAWDIQTLQNLLVRNKFRIINILLSKSSIKGGQSIIVKAQKVD